MYFRAALTTSLEILPRERLYSVFLGVFFSLCGHDVLAVPLKFLLEWEDSARGFWVEKESEDNVMACSHHEKLTSLVFITCLL